MLLSCIFLALEIEGVLVEQLNGLLAMRIQHDLEDETVCRF